MSPGAKVDDGVELRFDTIPKPCRAPRGSSGIRGLVEGFSGNQLAMIAATLFGQEGVRSQSSLVYGQMSMDLMAKGYTPEQILGTDKATGGIHPMTPLGATGDAAVLDEHLQNRKQGGPQSLPEAGQSMSATQPVARAQMDREIQMIKIWLQSLKLHFDDAQSKKEKQDQLKAEIKHRLTKALLPRS